MKNEIELNFENVPMEIVNDEMSFSLDEFIPEVFDCEADGSCGSGHVHVNTKT
ncbi:MAG: hypothetical protein RSI06_09520 [Lachnospiraceae bacterium]